MTDDSPTRELDTDHLVENYSMVVQTNRGGHSNVAGEVSSSMEVGTCHKTPRREVRWKFDKSANNRSLESIVRRFDDYLDCVLASSTDSPLRRITASPHKWASHRCPGYLREEIALTADVSRSVVIAHQYPSQSEICTICGQLVQYSRQPIAQQRLLQQGLPERPPKELLEKSENIKTEEDACVFLEQMIELIKKVDDEGPESFSSELIETVEMVLKGYGPTSHSLDGGSM